jgi:hypothetical protein
MLRIDDRAFNKGLEKALDDFQLQVLQRVRKGIGTFELELAAESTRNVPVITGRLRASVTPVKPKIMSRHEVRGAVGYHAFYAAYVHEHMEGRRPKFLEKAVLSVGPRLAVCVLKELQ